MNHLQIQMKAQAKPFQLQSFGLKIDFYGDDYSQGKKWQRYLAKDRKQRFLS